MICWKLPACWLISGAWLWSELKLVEERSTEFLGPATESDSATCELMMMLEMMIGDSLTCSHGRHVSRWLEMGMEAVLHVVMIDMWDDYYYDGEFYVVVTIVEILSFRFLFFFFFLCAVSFITKCNKSTTFNNTNCDHRQGGALRTHSVFRFMPMLQKQGTLEHRW